MAELYGAGGEDRSRLCRIALIGLRGAGKSTLGKRLADDRRGYDLMHDRANPYMTALVCREVLMAHVLTWGNGYAYVSSSYFTPVSGTKPPTETGSVKAVTGGSVNVRSGYDFGAQLSNLKLGVGVKNVFDQQHYTRSSDNNAGLYLGEPRTFFVQASVGF